MLNRFEEAMEKIDAMEKSFETKLDNKFNELLKRLPQPPPATPIAPLQRQQQSPLPNQFGRAKRVPLEDGQTFCAAVPTIDASFAPATTAAGAEEDDDYAGDYEDEVDQNQHYVQPPSLAPGRPHANNRNGRPAPPPQVRDNDHIPKLKLNIPPFEGRYVPDIYILLGS